MENNEQNTEVKNPSAIENFSKLSVKVGDKIGKIFTEFFTGKPLTEEQKQERREERDHQKLLRQIQIEARRRIEIEQAERGEYVPPTTKKTKKEDGLDIFKNLGKHNPLEDFNHSRSIGSQTFGVEKYSGNSNNIPDTDIEGYGDRNPHKTPDFGLEGFAGTVNPMENKRRRE